MKVKVQTESWSVYTIDFDARTVRRVGAVPIPGVSADEFALAGLLEADLLIGLPMVLNTARDGLITTTRIVRMELVA